MPARTVKQLHSVIHRLIKKWKTNLFLGMWKIDFTVRDYLHNNCADFQTMATCDADWRYFEATLNFSFIKMYDLEEEEIEKIVIHELLHIVVNEMREDGIEHEERVVSHLTMMVDWMNSDR